jgi:hypothetical protein
MTRANDEREEGINMGTEDVGVARFISKNTT